MSGRQQRVAIGEGNDRVVSETTEIAMGIPQGSVIGTLLFVLYTNDLRDFYQGSNLEVTSYADDTSFFTMSSQIPTLLSKVEEVMIAAKKWFLKNKLILNSSKTNIVLFTTQRSALDIPESVGVPDESLAIVDSTKSLGIVLDKHLTWDKHVEYIMSKLNKSCSRYASCLIMWIHKEKRWYIMLT